MLAVLLAATAVSTWQAVRATRAETKSRAALAAETAANARTREALDALTDDVVRTVLARQPELDEAERAFLRKVVGFYEEFTRQEGGTAEARFLRAKGHAQVAFTRKLLGESGGAEAGYREALALLGPLVDESPDRADYRTALAGTSNELGVILAEAGDEAGAEAAIRRALAHRTTLADRSPAVPQYRRGLAGSYNDLGFSLQRQQKFAEAEEAYRR